MEEVQRVLLEALDKVPAGTKINTDAQCALKGLDANTLYGALNSLSQRSVSTFFSCHYTVTSR